MKHTWITLVKTKMKELGISQEKLGELIGKTQGGVAHWLNGRREPGLDDIASIMRVLHIKEINIQSDTSVTTPQGNGIANTKKDYVPVIGEAIMSTEGEFDMCEDLTGWLQIYSPDPDAFSVRVKGDSMFPRINSGEFVVVEPNTQIHPGDEVFIRTIEGKNLIKRLAYYRESSYQFLSINLQYKPMTLDESKVTKVYYVAAIVKSSRYLDMNADLN